MAKISSLHIGDRVRLTGKFLRSTGQLTGPEGLSRWTIVGFWGDGKFALVNEPIDQSGYEDLPPDERPKWRSIAVGNLQKIGTATADLKRAKRSKPRRHAPRRKSVLRRARRRMKLRKRISRRRRVMSLPKAGMSKFKAQAAYDRASSAQRLVSREFQKTKELYRAGKITDAFFLAEQAKEKAALAAFDAADADLKAVFAHEEALVPTKHVDEHRFVGSGTWCDRCGQHIDSLTHDY